MIRIPRIGVDTQVNNTPLSFHQVDLKEGVLYLLKGTNASGKTTFLRGANLALAASDIDVVMQTVGTQMPPSTSPVEIVKLLTGSSAKDIAGMFNTIGLSSNAYSKRLDDLSAGMIQMVQLAIVMLSKHNVYLLDETLCNLDIRTHAKVLNMLAEKCTRESCTIVLVDHSSCISIRAKILNIEDLLITRYDVANVYDS